MRLLTILLLTILTTGCVTKHPIHNPTQKEDISMCKYAWIMSDLGEYNEADLMFLKCIEEGNLTPYQLGKAYRNLGINSKRWAITINSKQSADHKRIKALLFHNSIAYYNYSLDLIKSENHMDYVNKGNTYSEMRLYDKALAEYENSLNVYPNYNEAYYNRGIVYERMGKKEEAKDDFLMAFKHGLRTDYLLNRIMAQGYTLEEIEKKLGENNEIY